MHKSAYTSVYDSLKHPTQKPKPRHSSGILMLSWHGSHPDFRSYLNIWQLLNMYSAPKTFTNTYHRLSKDFLGSVTLWETRAYSCLGEKGKGRDRREMQASAPSGAWLFVEEIFILKQAEGWFSVFLNNIVTRKISFIPAFNQLFNW